MARTSHPLSISVVLLLLTAGCSDSANTGQTDAVVPRWSGAVDLVIDSINGRNEEHGVVADLAADRAGRLFVADSQYNVVSAFDSTGRFLYSIGRGGSGPGEFKNPCCLVIDEQGTLWLRDTGNDRHNHYVVSNTAGRFAGQVPTSAAGYPAPLTVDMAGRLIDIGALGENGVVRSHVDSTGRVTAIDSIAAPPEDSPGRHRVAQGSSTSYLYQPYGPSFLVAHAPGGGWARGVSSHYLLQWIVDGDTAHTLTIRRDMIGPALSARERTAANAELTGAAARLGLTGTAIPFGVPGSKTPVRDIMFDQQGRLWVELNVADGQVNRADVYDKAGKRVANAEWPGDVDLSRGFIADRIGYGFRRDSSGVSTVVRVRFRQL